MTKALPKTLSAIVVMGPSGAGKSTLARALAGHIGARFIEGDEHHPVANREKLAAGVPLGEADRALFLDSIGRAINDEDDLVVVSCSALRRAHRDRLRSHANGILFVWIDVPAEELERRVRERRDHFMAPSLLCDQLANFEKPAAPEWFVRAEGTVPTADQVRAIAPAILDGPPFGE